MIGLISEYPEMGAPLSGRWEGARRIHCADDKYRVVWDVIPDLKAVVILLVGKKQQRGGTLYDFPRPEHRWQLDQE
jgi:mRNA-degrading endonuclease RelE of RelBE toxin-antitoxin system